MTIRFLSIPQGIVDVYHRRGVVGAEGFGRIAGRKTDASSLMIITGVSFVVYWDELPSQKFVSEFMWRLT